MQIIKENRMEITSSKKIQIYAKSMNIEVFKVYVCKTMFLEGANKLNWFLKKSLGSSKCTVF